jgi:hypothetical protein
MRDQGLIIGGLAVFLGLITFPITYNVMSGKKSEPPKLQLPAAEKQCVAPIEYMKASHMKLLFQWRDERVRQGVRTYTAYDGKTYTISFTGTCLSQCHTDKAEFCDRCHNYVGIRTPNCTDCHVDPKLIQRSGE